MVPRQRQRKWCYGNNPVPITHEDTGAKRKRVVSASCKMVGCSRLPGSHELVAWKRVTIRIRCKHKHLIHNMHSFTGVVSAVIPSKRAKDGSRSVQSRRSRCSRVV